MKPNVCNPFLAAILLVAVSSTARADLFDTNGTSAGFGVADGGSYDWLDTGFWNTGTGAAQDAGTDSTVTWVPASQAYFAGAGAGTTYTVRLGSAGATDVSLGNLGINLKSDATGALAGAAGSVTIGNAGDTGFLVLAANNSVGAQAGGTLTINNRVDLNANTMFHRGGNVTINGAISGNGASNLSLAGGGGTFGLSAGTLVLAGDNSFAGNTSVASGYVLSLRHANALGAAGGTNSVTAGGTLEVANGIVTNSAESVSITGDGGSFIGALRAGSGGGTWAGGVTLAGTARIGATAGNTLTVTGSIANGAGSTFNVSGQSGTGVVVLNPTSGNTYTGTTGIIRGILRLGKDDALPTGTTLDVDSASSVSDAATFDLAGFNQTIAALQDSAALNVNGKITNSLASTASTLTVNQASSTTFDGVIEDGSGTVALTKGGAGNLTLNGASTYTGGTNIRNGSITINGGNDRLATSGAVQLGDVGTSGKLVLGSATTARNQTLAGLTATGLGGRVVGAHASNNSTLTLNIASGLNDFAGTLGGPGTNENRLALTKTGAGTLALSGANTYSGTTTLSSGTIRIGVDSAGSVGAITSSAIGTGGLTFNGGNLSSDGTAPRTILNAVTFAGNAALGDATDNGKLTFEAGLNLGGAARTLTVNSDVQLNGAFSNPAATSGLNKAGAGTLTINAANTSFGGSLGFSLQAGTVVASNPAALGNAGQIVTLGTSTTTGTLDLATDTTVNAWVVNLGSGNTGTLVVNRATAAADMTQTLGVATLGNGTLNLEKGANVTGDGTLEFGGITLAAGVSGLSTGAMLNPTSAKVLVSGNITRSGSSANLLTLDGTSSGNLVSGIISGSQALTKSNSSTWELSNANTFSGRTLVAGGTLVLSHNLALQNSAYDTSGAGSLDISALTTPTFGGLAGGGNLTLHGGITALTLNPTSGTQTYTGDLGGGASGLTLTKSGAGTQVLSGTSSYSGLTTVSGGELRITNAGAIGGDQVTVTAGQLALDGGITVGSTKSLTTSGSGTNFFGGLQSVTGTNTWSGSVTLGADLSRIGTRKNAMLVVSGVIDDGANSFGLVVRNENLGGGNNGAGNSGTVTVLSGANTYGGNTVLIHGLTMLDGGDDRLPTGTVLQFGTATTNAKFDMNGRNQELAGLAVLSTGTDANRDWNANELTNSSATRSTLTLNTTANQTFGGSLANNVGVITGNIDLVKSGAAQLTLSGPNSYTGTTTIGSGTLALGTGGSISASTTIDVQGTATFDVSALSGWTLASGQTLAGNGTVEAGGTGKVVTVASGAFLAPGASPGTLLVHGDLALAGGSTFVAELQTSGIPTADLVDLDGNLDILSGALLDLGLFGSDAALAPGSKFSLLSYSGAWNSGTFSSYGDDSSFFLGLNQFVINYDDTGGGVNGGSYSNFVTLTVVPEPRAALLAALGLFTLLRRRRLR